MTLDVVDNLAIFALSLCPCGRGIEPVAVAARDIGDVPYGIGTGTVLQCATRHGIGEAFQRTATTVERTCVVVGCSIVCAGLEGIGLLVPHGRVQVDVGSLGTPLSLNVGIVECIEQSCAIEADGRLQAYIVLCGLRVGVEGCLRNGHHGIDERILLAICKLHRQSTLHLLHLWPLNLDLRLVDGSLEGRHGLCLRHACHLADVGIVRRMIDNEQITIANLIGAVFGLAFAVTVAGMAGNTAVAHPCWAEALAWILLEGVEVFEEVLTSIEVFLHASNVNNCRRCCRIAGFLSGTELSTRIPLVGREHVVGLAEGFSFRHEGSEVDVVVIMTCCE